MPLDTLPSEIIVKSRDEIRDSYLKWYRFRQPDADIGPDDQPWIDASCVADQVVVLMENARRIGRNIPLSEKQGDALDQFGAELDAGSGDLARFPALPAHGFVIVRTGPTGSTIWEGDELIYQNVTYVVTLTDEYRDQQQVPVQAKTGGPLTNRAAGDVLTWISQRPGCYSTASVAEGGITNGRDAESDDEYRQRLSDALADPAAQGNGASVRRWAENSTAHGVSVAKAFSYSSPFGPGTTGLVFTMKPSKAGGSRIPNAVDVSKVAEYVASKLSEDDNLFEMMTNYTQTSVAFEVAWDVSATGWAARSPWPQSYATNSGAQIVTTVVYDALNFSLGRRDGTALDNSYAPGVGTPLAFWDGSKFVRKVVKTKPTGSSPWAIECDSSASDMVYVPAGGQPCGPWSDSLYLLVSPIVSYFDSLGPGEIFVHPIGNGRRQARTPAPSAKSWPASISDRVAYALTQLDAVAEATLLPDSEAPRTPPVGFPGVLAFMLQLQFITVYAKL